MWDIFRYILHREYIYMTSNTVRYPLGHFHYAEEDYIQKTEEKMQFWNAGISLPKKKKKKKKANKKFFLIPFGLAKKNSSMMIYAYYAILTLH